MQSTKLFLYITCLAGGAGCSPPPQDGEVGGGPDTGELQFVNNPDRADSEPKPANREHEPAASQELIPPANQADCGPFPPNLIQGSDFEYRPIHACGWETFDASGWGTVAALYCYEVERGGCSAYLESDVWGDPWVTQFSQVVKLEAEREYILLFEAKAAGEPRPLTVAVLGAGPLDGLGSGITLTLEPEWRLYHLLFRATDWDGRSIVDFAFGGAASGLYLDNVALVPTPPPKDSP